MDSKVVIAIVCVVILVIIGVAIYCYYKFCVPSDDDNNKALEFIKGYQSVFEEIIQSVIDDLDLSDYKSIIDYELDVFTIAYEKCWEYIEEQVTEALSNSSIGKLIAKCITKDNVEMIVELIFNTFFTSTIEAKYTEQWETSNEEAIAEDERLQHEADLYETDQKEVPEYVEAESIPDIVEIKPQTDEEEPYNPDDIGMEMLEEISPEDYKNVDGQISLSEFIENVNSEDYNTPDDE